MVCRPASSTTSPSSANASLRNIFRVASTGRMKFKLRKPQIPCGVCGKLFLSKKSASAHLHKNHSVAEVNKINYKFKCTVCLRGFETLVGLNLHRYRNHRLPPVVQALKYPKLLPKLAAPAAASREANDDDDDNTHECGLCFRICKTKAMLRMHISTVHKEALPAAAQVVSSPAISTPKTEEPTVINAPPLPENLECSICYQPFRNVNGLVNHLRTSHGKPSCNICLEIFTTQEELIAHRQTHKPGYVEPQAEKIPQPDVFTCTICGKSFDNSTSLSRHKGYHTKMGPHWQPSDLNNSGSAVTPPTNRANHNRSASSPNNLNDSPRKIYPCNICNKQFEGSLSLARHKACHIKLGPHWVPGASTKNSNTSLPKPTENNSNDDYEPVEKKPNVNDGQPVDKASVQKLKSNATSIPFCLYCKKIFESQNKLWDHICLMHPSDSRYRCQDPGCNRVFFSGTGFRSHQTAQGHNQPPETANSNKSVGGSGPSLAFLHNSQPAPSSSGFFGITGSKCYICMRKFTNTQNLKRHIKQAHRGVSQPPVQLKINPVNIVNTYSRKLNRVLCRYCPKYLSSKYISEHEKMHRIRGDKLRASGSTSANTEQGESGAIEYEEGETIEVRPDMVEEDEDEQEDNPINADIEVNPLSIQLEPMKIPDSITITQTAVPRVSMSSHSNSPSSEVSNSHRKTPKAANCKYCGVTYENFADLKDHLDEYHPGMIYHVCDGCPEIYYDRQTLVSHNIVHTRVYLNCKHCGKSFARPLSLRAHENKCLYLQRREQKMQNNSNQVMNAYNCEFCSEKFSDSISFVQHLQSHAN